MSTERKVVLAHGYWAEKGGDIGDLSRAVAHACVETIRSGPKGIERLILPTDDCNNVGVEVGIEIGNAIIREKPGASEVIWTPPKGQGGRDTYGEMMVAKPQIVKIILI